MRNAGGALIIHDPDAKQMEVIYDSFTCWHCNHVTVIKTARWTENVCKKCLDYKRAGSGRVCDGCYGKPCPGPHEAQIEAYEHAHRPRLIV